MSRTDLVKKLNIEYPSLSAELSEDKGFTDGGIWVDAESSTDKEGLPLFDYWTEDYKEVLYVMKVRKPLYELLDKAGYFAEFQDAGTVLIWE